MSLLKLILIVAATISLSVVQAVESNNPSESAYEVVVIGGGLSGLATLEMLAKKGIHNVLLLEKNEQAGGKMWTERGLQDQNGPYYERGAELVNTSDVELIDLIKNLGLGLTARRFKNENREEVFLFADRHVDQNGQVVTGQLKTFKYEQLIEKMHEIPQDMAVLAKLYSLQQQRQSLQGAAQAEFKSQLKGLTAMSQVAPGAYTKAFFESLMQSEFGVSLTQVNAEVLLDYAQIIKQVSIDGSVKFDLQIIPEADEKFRITGGTDTVIQKLVQRYQQKISVDSVARSVEQISTNDFAVKYSVGSQTKTIKAQHVVFAVPAYELPKMHINIPEITPAKLQQAATLPFGENAKVFLVFDSKFWEKSYKANPNAFAGVALLEQGIQVWETTENQITKEGVITLYPGQWPVEPAEQQKKLQEVLAQLKKVPGFKNMDQHLIKTDVQLWQKSYAGVFNSAYARSPRLFVDNHVANVYFVGSDKDSNARGEISASYGYMNGAVRTSIRAAERISIRVNQIETESAATVRSCQSLFSEAG